jgi:hypothetical protein
MSGQVSLENTFMHLIEDRDPAQTARDIVEVMKAA